MKNPLIVIGILLFMTGIFLPWGPKGTAIETGFNEEGSPGLLGILVAISFFLFAFRTSKKSYYVLIFLSILAILLPLTVMSKIMEAGVGFSAVEYGIYVMMASMILVIFGCIKGIKTYHNLS